ncbi:hypothetical protein ScPMuIL_004600 [Solemya velum]
MSTTCQECSLHEETSGGQLLITSGCIKPQMPIKVDVEIKVSFNNTEYIFPGTGSAHIDDDLSDGYGGAVYVYDETHIKIFVPNRNNGRDTGYVVFIDEKWDGIAPMNISEALVRARVWRHSDAPRADFFHNWTNISNGSYSELIHRLPSVPSYVVVQVAFEDGNSTFISEGQGSAQLNIRRGSLHSGGVLFGFDDTEIRIWAGATYIMLATDGWGDSSSSLLQTSGKIRVFAWILPTDAYFKHVNLSDDIISFQPAIDINTALISVEVIPRNGNNSGFHFPAIGSAVVEPHNPISGVIYAYSNTSVALWKPDHTGYMLYFGSEWGGGVMSEMSRDADIIVKAVRLVD